jgi:hypothetical protein
VPERPTTAAGYGPGQIDLVRSACLYVATKLGDLAEDLVIVGGLVPSLLVDQHALPPGAAAHAGTMDLDVGLSLGLLDRGRYRTLAERLRRAGFSPDVNEEGNPTRQTWRIDGTAGRVTIDFLIAPSRADDQGGKLRNIERDFAAVIAPGLSLAFVDRRKVPLSGVTIFGEEAEREVWVCGPAAYVVLKALAFAGRGENKDAYDLYYVVRNYGNGIEDVLATLRPLLSHPEAGAALDVLRRDFLDHDAVGPRRVAEFIHGGADGATQADVVGFLRQLVRGCERAG